MSSAMPASPEGRALDGGKIQFDETIKLSDVRMAQAAYLKQYPASPNSRGSFAIPLPPVELRKLHVAAVLQDDSDRRSAGRDHGPCRVRPKTSESRKVCHATAAIRKAASIRPTVLMTALAAFFALIPMALAFQRGSEANAPLGRAVIGGILAGLITTLFVVPSLYSLVVRDARLRDLTTKQVTKARMTRMRRFTRAARDWHISCLS